jgi:TetR/AcrR family transcriptional repressor of nem operon
MARTHSSIMRQAAIGPLGTAGQILDVAERLAQTRGFNGFSDADVTKELGITEASLHYHFPEKASLGRALIDRYAASFSEALSRIETSAAAAPAKLERYVAIYAGMLKSGRICLCGMLAAEYNTLPASMQEAIRAFFDSNERWLASVLESGRKDGTLAFDGEPEQAARSITAAIEGAMLLARLHGRTEQFTSAAQRLLNHYSAAR